MSFEDKEAKGALAEGREAAGLDTGPRLKLVHALELIKDRTPPEYLIKGWLPASGTSWTYGPFSSGKSWIALDQAEHIAAGMEWRGCKVKQGPVIYLAGEGAHGIKLRLAAWLAQKPQVKNFSFPLYVSETGGSFSDEGLQDVFDAIDCSAPPVLIVIDTQARWQVGNENGTEDGSAYVRAVDALRDRYKCLVNSVHHTGKNAEAGMRGSTTYAGAADVAIEVTKKKIEDVPFFQIKTTKVKDGAEGSILNWSLQTCPLEGWLDIDGEQVHSAYVVEVDEMPNATDGRPKIDIPPEDIKRLVLEYPFAGKAEMLGFMKDRFKVSSDTARRRFDELVGLGVLVDHPGGRGKKTTYTIGEGHEL
jgi:hypothetical protein